MKNDREKEMFESEAFWLGTFDAVDKITKILLAFKIAPLILYSKAKEIIEQHEKEGS